MSTAVAHFGTFFDIPPFDTGVSDAAKQLRSSRAKEPSRQLSPSTQDREKAVQELFLAIVTAVKFNEPIELRTAGWALAFLRELPAWVPNPEISIDHDGDMFLEWDYGRRCVFSVSVGPNADLSYAGLFGISVSHGAEAFAGEIPRGILAGIERAADTRRSALRDRGRRASS